MNQLINDEGVCRTAPATPGLLNIYMVSVFHKIYGCKCRLLSDSASVELHWGVKQLPPQ